MSILEVEGLTFSYQGESMYQHGSMRLFEGEHAVLVGPNGTGKSTLLKLLDKRLIPDKGLITWLPNLTIGYLDQYAEIDPKLKVKTYLYDVFLPLFEKEEEMNHLYHDLIGKPAHEQEKMLHWAADLQEQLMDSEFYRIKSSVGNIIHGLGLEMEILERTISTLSGGMRAKIILGKLLLSDADVLLLDEPTNFLDVKHIEWLAKFLNAYQKAFLVVSHHEGFLSEIARTVFALEHGLISRYKGDFSYYLSERELRSEQHEKAYKAQQRFIKKNEEFIRKNIVRDKTVKRAQSRRKMLAKLDRIKPPQSDTIYKFRFPFSSGTGRDVLITDNLEIGYSYPLLEPLSMTIRKQDKVAITGENGVGKTTFVKTILELIPKIDGSFKWIDTAKIAYFAQDEKYPDVLTAFDVVHEMYPDFTKKDVMSLLGHHGINYDMARREMNSLSGGEQTKVRLALLYHQKGNILILDEPTNHLDQAAKEALKDALIQYEGTLILISHEVEFYQDICDYEITLFEPEDE